MSSPDRRAVEADDRLLDALGAGELAGTDLADDPAIAALADWRAALATAPIPDHAGPGRPHADAAERSAHLLDRASRLLVSDPHLDASRAARLDARLHRLRTRLASLPASTTGTASSPSAVPGPGTGTAVTRQAPGRGRSDGPTPGPSGTAPDSGHPHGRITDTALPTPPTRSLPTSRKTSVPASARHPVRGYGTGLLGKKLQGQ